MQHTMVHVCICLECLYPGRPLCIFLSCDSPFSFAGSELFPQVDVQDSRSLVSLPVDALGEILARVESLADVRCLTRSCKAFLACSRSEHVQAAWLMAHCPVSSSCPGPRPCPTTQHIGEVSDCRWVVKGFDGVFMLGLQAPSSSSFCSSRVCFSIATSIITYQHTRTQARGRCSRAPSLWVRYRFIPNICALCPTSYTAPACSVAVAVSVGASSRRLATPAESH